MRKLVPLVVSSLLVLSSCSTSRAPITKKSRAANIRSQVVHKTAAPKKLIPKTEASSCPHQSGTYLLPRTYDLKSIFVSFADDELVPTVIRSATEQNLDIDINIVIGQQDWEPAWSALRPFREFKNVNFLVAPTPESFWVQDYLEVGTFQENGSNFFVELPYWERGAEAMPITMALWKKWELFMGPTEFNPGETHGNGDYGGNVEPMPNGKILIGDNMARTMRGHLRRVFPMQELVDISVSWLETGHVDELMSLIPTDKNSCGYVVFYASPALGLKLLAENRNGGPLAAENPPRADPTVYPFTGCGMAKNIDKCLTVKRANLVYEKLIQANVNKLKSHLKEGCENPEFVPLPQIFHPAFRQDKFGTADDGARSLNPNTVNNLLVGKDLIFAQQNNFAFAKYINERVTSLGLRPVPIDVRLLHSYSGGIHCATLSGYSCQPQ